MIPVNGPSFGRRTGLAPLIARRRGVAQHLAHGLAGQSKPLRRFALADPLDVDAAAYLCVELHAIHPSRVPQNTSARAICCA